MSITAELISTKHELLGVIAKGVNFYMGETKSTGDSEFWLFYDLEEEELSELRKFIDPDMDLKSLEGIDDLFTRLNHILE